MGELNLNKIIIFLIPILLAVLTLNYGLPLKLIGDESAFVGGAMKMVELKTLIPSFHPDEFRLLYYPVIIPYLVIIASLPVILFKLLTLEFSFSLLRDYFALNQDLIWVSARALSLLFSIFTLAVIYNLGKNVFNKRVGSLATILLVFSFYHNNLSHWIKHWTFSVFFAYWSFLLIYNLVKEKNIKKYLPGLVAATGAATNYISVLGIFFGGAYAYFKRKEIKKFWPIVLLNLTIFVFVSGGLFFLHREQIFTIFLPREGGTILATKSFSDMIRTLGLAFQLLFKHELIITTLAVLSLFFSKQFRKENFFIFGFAVIYFLIIYLVFHLEPRYIYFVAPALCFSAAGFLDFCDKKLRSKIIFKLLLLIIFIWPGSNIIQYNRLLLQPNTLQQATNWIAENINKENFIINSTDINLLRTPESLEIAEGFGRINARERYFLNNFYNLRADLYPVKLYNYQNIHFWENQDNIETYMEENIPKYFVVAYWDRNELSLTDNYLIDHGKLIKRFRQSDTDEIYDINGNFYKFNSILFKIKRLGPIVDVYKIN